MPKYHDVSGSTSESVTGVRSTGRAGIVLHSTEGVDSLEWLQGGSARSGKPASADYLVTRAGDIYQITAHLHFAYHVGVGTWRGIHNSFGRLNECLVGIELESIQDNHPRYTDEQIISSVLLVRALFAYHRLDVLGLVRHGDIALPPGRRSDPVAFPAHMWTRELMSPPRHDTGLVFPEVLP